MGCGKSSVGRRLSQLLCCRFMDLDSAIEERQGRSVQEIFAMEGEGAFRAMELETLETLTGASLCVHSDEDMSLSVQEGNGIDPMYSRGPLPQSGPLPLAGGGRMPLSYYWVNTSDSRDVKSDVLVLALGGGTVMTPECERIIRENTCCIYLKASVETLIEHLDNEADKRPLLSGGELRTQIESLLSRRSATYERTAHMIIDTDGKTVDEIASAIYQRGA